MPQHASLRDQASLAVEKRRSNRTVYILRMWYVAAVAWGLALVHLLMTLFTRFPLGLVKVIPFPIHGVVELVVGVVLVFAMPRLLGASLGSPARTFFIGAGAAILAVWALTRYRESPRP